MALYCLDNARTDEQRARMVALEAQGICLFCAEGLALEGQSGPLLETSSWTVVDNDFPYQGSRRHLLLIPRAHVHDLVELDSTAQSEFWQVLKAARELCETSHYGLGVRNGDCAATGATIAHLHVHLLVAADLGDRPLRMRFSGRRP